MKTSFKISGIFLLIFLIYSGNSFSARRQGSDSAYGKVEGRDNRGRLRWRLEYMPIKRIPAVIYNAYPKLTITLLVILAVCASCIAREIMWQREEQIFFNG